MMSSSKDLTILGLPPAARSAIKRVISESVPKRWKLLVLSIFCMVGVAGFTSAMAYSTKLIVNDVFAEGRASGSWNPSDAWKVALLIILVTSMKGIFQYFNAIVSLMFNKSIASEYKRKIFAKRIDGDVRALSTESAAFHITQLKVMSTSASSVVVSLTNGLVTDVLTLVGLLFVMINQDPLMSLMAAILFPVIFYMVAKLTKKIRIYASEDMGLEGGVASVGAEAFEGVKTVKSYGLEEKSKSKFSAVVDKIEERQLTIGKIASLTMPLMEALGGVIVAAFVVYASWQTLSNDRTPGEFTAFIAAFLLAYQPAERISKLWISVQRSILHVEDMYKILDQPVDHYDEQSERLKEANSSVEFQNVSYMYDGEHAALDNVSFFVDAGERIAIVGRSGSGKTTLVDLIQDFCVPDSGTIKIGGIDTKDVAKNEIRKNVALISQDVFLFDASIAENVRDGNPDISEAELLEVAKRAAIFDFSGNIDEILETKIGPQGSVLSGGQKQRVAIARAFAKKAKIYIFDEATSALDGENERSIMSAAVNSDKDSTMFFVTHRSSTLKWVDRVLLLQDGKVLAFDTHDSLMANDKRYRSLFHMTDEALA